MQWILNYSLFLFDFDGLLADTEYLHYRAYIQMCASRGFVLKWDFNRYTQVAHHDSTGLRDQIYAQFPSLHAMEPDWQILYAEKKQIFLDLLENEPVPLMPGASELLLALQQAGVKRCVVTHSPLPLIERVRRQNPVLDTIPHWITREDYTHPKPDPECYQMAVAKYALPNDTVIGFEDSPRGLHALLGTRAKPIFVCPPDSNTIKKVLHEHPEVSYFPSLLAISL